MTHSHGIRLSVVILSFNGMDHLPECLSSLDKQTGKPFELIVIDNGSTDGSMEWLHENYPGATIIPLGKNMGFCRGMNQGLKHASGDWVLLLNQDVRLAPDCLHACVQALKTPPSDPAPLDGMPRAVAGVFPKIMFHAVPGFINALGSDWFEMCHWRDVRVGLPDLGGFDMPETVFGSIFPAVIVHRRILLDAGAFDPMFWSYCEDFDLCYRLNIMGCRFVTAPAAVIYHKYRASSRDTSDPLWSRYWFIRNYLLVFLKNYERHNLAQYGRRIFRRYLGNVMTAARRSGNRREWWMCVRIIRSLVFNSPRIILRRLRIQKRRLLPDRLFWRTTQPVEDFNIFHVEGCIVLSLLSMRYAEQKVESYRINDVEFSVR